jgi:error-prone DNA polymerase
MASAPYIELHAHSAFSFLDGASTPTELAAAAAALDYPALALTDHDGLWGSMEFAHACKSLGLRPITGAELSVALPAEVDGPQIPALLVFEAHQQRGAADLAARFGGRAAGLAGRGAHSGRRELVHVTLLVEDTGGYRNLCRLLTAAHSHTRDNTARSAGAPWVTIEQVEEHAAGLVCLSGCARDGALAGAWERRDTARGERLGRRLLAAFGPERFRVELQRPYWRHDRARNRWLATLAERLGVPCVATGNVHAHNRRRTLLQDAFVAVRLGETLEESEPRRRGNRSSALVSPRAMAARFAEHPEAVAETVRLAERLRFDLTEQLGYRHPRQGDRTADLELAGLCRYRLAEVYGGNPRRPEAEARLEQELGTIRHLNLSGFFLLHHELLELAREVAVEVRGDASARSVLPPGRGRGSSVSSIVCYLTGLSHIDPVEAELFAGRFLNDEATSMPDIDLDFPRDIREVLIPRVHERYGADRSALVAAFPTYRPRGVVRDLGKVLGLAPEEIERVARTVGFHESAGEIERDVLAAIGPERAATPRWKALLWLCPDALGLPRHASQHSGGMVISTEPLVDVCPVVPAAMAGRQIVQWDKDSCADAGFLKIDLLGLGMLSAVERCVDEVERTRGEPLDLSRIPLDDEETFESIRAAKTTGVFQIESRAQMQMLPRTQPRNIDDLTVQVALVRPGPIQGGAVHPYIERRKLLREDPAFEVPYEHPLLVPVLEETLGTIVYQEQVIEVAMALAGFSSSEAEGLRRAMSRKRSQEEIEKHRARFVAGAIAGRHAPAGTPPVSIDVAERVWAQIQGFSGFGFPKAHSTAFGLLAYQSAWLRIHFGPEFLCALLNEQPMGFYPPDSLVHEAQRRGIRIAPPDANRSRLLCHVESPREREEARGGLVVRIGLGYVKGVREGEMEALVRERERGGSYGGVAELASRSGAGLASLERLAWAGALDGIPAGSGSERREALWRVGVTSSGRGSRSGTQLALPVEPPEPPELDPLGDWGKLIADYRSTGIAIDKHALELLRPGLDPALSRSTDLARIEDGATVEVAGMVVARQRPETAKGIVFMLLEDERGTVNLIVPARVYDRHRALVRNAPLVRARGRLERREGAINVLVAEVRALERAGRGDDDARDGGAPAGRVLSREGRPAGGAVAPFSTSPPAPPARSAGDLDGRRGDAGAEMDDSREREGAGEEMDSYRGGAQDEADSGGQRGRAEDGTGVDGRRELAVAELRAVAPVGHSFGRRGR